MKIVEKLLAALAILGIIMNLFMLAGAGPLTIISLSLLSMMYFMTSFLLLNNIGLRQLFKGNPFQGISQKRILGAVFSGVALSIACVGIIFTVQMYPSAKTQMGMGTLPLVIISLIALLKYNKTKAAYYQRVLSRTLTFGVIGVFFMLLPEYAIIEFKYRDYPGYVEALKAQREDPNNEALWEKVEEERRKIDYPE